MNDFSQRERRRAAAEKYRLENGKCPNCPHDMGAHADGVCDICGKDCGGFQNADDSDKCSRCGTKVGAMGVDHGYDVYCVDCAVERGYIDKKDVPDYENADEVKFYLEKWKQKLGGGGHELRTIIDWAEGAGLAREETDRLIKEIRRCEGI